MGLNIDGQSIRTVALREARLALASPAVLSVLALIIVGMIGLVIFTERKVGSVDSGDAADLFLSCFILVATSIVIMMNTTLVGASICDEKDKRVTEILLSAVNPAELFLGKVLGAGFVGIIQVAVAWLAVVVSLGASGLVDFADMNWSIAAILLLSMGVAYFAFTGLFAFVGAMVSKNDQYTAAQLPVLIVLFGAMAVPFAPMLGWGSFGEGWVQNISWIPPLSMAGGPMEYFFGDGRVWLLVVSLLGLFAFACVTLKVAEVQYRRRVLT
ncbi:ABC transporter permease [Corynebacterium frankenforstense]|uniref:ABC transporter permease n=1 Tax=Corynebacterium TaxID=1716 RepID=UPI00254D965F|nr:MULTISPECIES: ABC transporter permease [Corynebacterium]MDK6259797.1 ABC transporter permease [Corynebacterium frankenforstense]MDK8894267.1 ABC transporter permease [Corynebacterium sp. MSK006]